MRPHRKPNDHLTRLEQRGGCFPSHEPHRRGRIVGDQGRSCAAPDPGARDLAVDGASVDRADRATERMMGAEMAPGRRVA